jgi:hypothetical protein
LFMSWLCHLPATESVGLFTSLSLGLTNCETEIKALLFAHLQDYRGAVPIVTLGLGAAMPPPMYKQRRSLLELTPHLCAEPTLLMWVRVPVLPLWHSQSSSTLLASPANYEICCYFPCFNFC